MDRFVHHSSGSVASSGSAPVLGEIAGREVVEDIFPLGITKHELSVLLDILGGEFDELFVAKDG